MEQRTLRRKDRAMNDEDCQRLLRAGDYCTLATADDQGQPYAVPLSYVWRAGRICFHCARDGHKVANLRDNPRASAAVVGSAKPVFVPGQGGSVLYESVVAFGPVTEIVDETEKSAILYALMEKYVPEHMDEAGHYVQSGLKHTAVYALTPEVVSGKARRE